MHDRCRSSPDDRPPRVAGAGHALGPRYTAGRDLAVAYLEAGRPAEPLDSAQAAPLHARDDQDVHTSISCCVVIARALAAVGDS